MGKYVKLIGNANSIIQEYGTVQTFDKRISLETLEMLF